MIGLEIGEGKVTRSNMAAMSAGGIVTPSFLMNRKPWVEAAERIC